MSEKVHAIIPKGIVGGFEFTPLQRNLKEWHKKPCLRVLKESKKSRLDSYSVRNSVLIIPHVTFRDCRVHFFATTFLEIAVFSKEIRSFGISRIRIYDPRSSES